MMVESNEASTTHQLIAPSSVSEVLSSPHACHDHSEEILPGITVSVGSPR